MSPTICILCGINPQENMNHMCNECAQSIKNPVNTVRPVITTYDLYVVPEWKFILYSAASLGLFTLFWFYRLWKYFKYRNAIDISPFWRAFFGGFFAGPLASRVRDLLQEKGIQNSIWPAAIGIVFIAMNVSGRAPGAIGMLAYLSFLPLLPIVSGVRNYALSEGKTAKSHMEWWEIVLVVVGLMLFVMLVSIDISEIH